MNGETTIKIALFQPEEFSAEKKSRLESLLAALDEAVAERKKINADAQAEALAEWLKDPATHQTKHDFLAAINAMPQDRWPAMIDEFAKENPAPSALGLIAQLNAFTPARQKEALAYASSAYGRFIDPVQARRSWKKVDGLYETILAEFPEIISNKEDILGVIRLGKLFEKEKDSLTASWKEASGEAKLEKAKALLAKAYPADDVEHMCIAPVAVKKMAAGFNTCLAADTMLCGPLFMEGASWAFPMYLMTHEFQHRRQLRLVDRLDRNEIMEGCAEYYQARLLKANFEGGYLSPMTAKNSIAMIAGLTDYFEQPVEAQANDNAKLASKIGGTGGDIMWAFSEKLSKIFSAAARPLDKAVYGVTYATQAIASIGRKKPGV